MFLKSVVYAGEVLNYLMLESKWQSYGQYHEKYCRIFLCQTNSFKFCVFPLCAYYSRAYLVVGDHIWGSA